MKSITQLAMLFALTQATSTQIDPALLVVRQRVVTLVAGLLLSAFMGSRVLAESVDTCSATSIYNSNKLLTVPEIVDEAFGDTTWGVDWEFQAPVQIITKTMVSGCNDQVFLENLVLEIDKKMESLDIRDSDILGSEKDYDLLGKYYNVTLELYFLGLEKYIHSLLDRLWVLHDDGNRKATMALYSLRRNTVSYTDDSLYENISDYGFWTDFYSEIYNLDRDFWNNPIFDFEARFQETADGHPFYESIDESIKEQQSKIDNSVNSLIARAEDLGHPLASFHRISHGEKDFYPCSNNHIESNFRVDPSKKFRNHPDPRQALENVRNWLEKRARIVTATTVLAFEDMVVAIGAANIASDCAYSKETGKKFGIEDHQMAIDFIQLAASMPNTNDAEKIFGGRNGLAIALAIDKDSEDDRRHYASARFLLSGFAGIVVNDDPRYVERSTAEKMETVKGWYNKYSNATIREAQSILKNIGLYRFGIDGVPGPGFLASIMALDCNVEKYVSACLLGEASDIRRSDWARPFLTGPR